MVDNCSRLWHLSDNKLFTYFTATHLQNKPWQLYHLKDKTAAAIHLVLL